MPAIVKTLFLFAILAIVLCANRIALAAEIPDADIEKYAAVRDAVGNGYWYPAVAVGLSLLMSVWGRLSPAIGDRLSPYKAYVTLAVSLASAFILAFTRGQTFDEAVFAAAITFATSWPAAIGMVRVLEDVVPKKEKD